MDEQIRQASSGREGMPESARELLHEALTWEQRARTGDDPAASLTKAIQLNRQAEASLTGPDLAVCLLNRGNAQQMLAGLGVNLRASLEASIEVYQQAQSLLVGGKVPELVGLCVMNEASAWSALAELEVDSVAGLRHALRLYQEARSHFPDGLNGAILEVNEADARVSLAELGVDPLASLTTAISLYRSAASRLTEGPDLATCLLNMGTARQRLAELGLDSERNLRETIALYRRARSMTREPQQTGSCLLNEGYALQTLAERRPYSQANSTDAIRLLEEAIHRYGQAQQIFAGADRRNRARALANEASARQLLASFVAEMGFRTASYANLRWAVKLYREARSLFDQGHDVVLWQENERLAVESLRGSDILFLTETAPYPTMRDNVVAGELLIPDVRARAKAAPDPTTLNNAYQHIWACAEGHPPSPAASEMLPSERPRRGLRLAEMYRIVIILLMTFVTIVAVIVVNNQTSGASSGPGSRPSTPGLSVLALVVALTAVLVLLVLVLGTFSRIWKSFRRRRFASATRAAPKPTATMSRHTSTEEQTLRNQDVEDRREDRYRPRHISRPVNRTRLIPSKEPVQPPLGT